MSLAGRLHRIFERWHHCSRDKSVVSALWTPRQLVLETTNQMLRVWVAFREPICPVLIRDKNRLKSVELAR